MGGTSGSRPAVSVGAWFDPAHHKSEGLSVRSTNDFRAESDAPLDVAGGAGVHHQDTKDTKLRM